MEMMMNELLSWGVSPAWPVLFIGVLALFLDSYYARKIAMIIAPLLGFAVLFAQPMNLVPGGEMTAFGMVFETFRYDSLARIFALVFLIATLLNSIYAWHEDNRLTDGMALIYAAGALGAIFAGDFVTLFVFWELTALSSVFLIWARRGDGSFNAGMRYLAIQVTSGVLLLAGALAVYADSGALTFETIDPTTIGGLLILISFGIKAGFPLLHSWLPDAYPRATATGAVVLSAFTTKLAIYALARGFAGFEPLIIVGAVMIVFASLYAFMVDDLRRVLAYSLIAQLGFMVIGIGIGTAAALNGVAAHAFVSVIYKGLLFMALGAVLHRAGTTRASDLGGLYRTMPITALFAIIGGLSIAGLPLFSGFVAKSFVLNELAKSS
jgi:multicomponent Na+:H+ antiporter subunit D